MIETINPPGMPVSPAYSQGALAVGAQKMLFIAGQVGVDGQGNVPDGVGEQALLAIANLNRVLDSAGMTSADIARYTIYLTDERDMEAFVAAAGGALPSPSPAATLIFVKALAGPNLKVEIEAVAVS